jgi:hypothetical protein
MDNMKFGRLQHFAMGDLSAIQVVNVSQGEKSFLPGTNMTIVNKIDSGANNLKQGGKDGQQGEGWHLKRPKGWLECIQMLFTSNVKSFFQLSNPDGYLYLYFLKTSALMFALSKPLPHLFSFDWFNLSDDPLPKREPPNRAGLHLVSCDAESNCVPA